MKKLLFLILFISLSFLGHSQYNITQNLGGPTTLVQNPNYGGFRGGLIPYTFSDTTSANSLASLLKLYNGALIYCTADNAVYWRDATNQKWVQLLPSGGTGGLSAWLTTGNFAVPTDVNGYAKFGTFGTNGINVITSGNTVFKIHADGIVPDTGTVQGLGVNSYGELSYFSGGGGATPTWQQTLTAGSTLTGNNTIAGGGFDFTWDNMLSFTVNDASNDRLVIDGTQSILFSPNNTRYFNITNSTTGIFGLANLSTQDRLIGQRSTTSEIGYITIGSGLSLSSGVLSNSGVVTTPTWQQTLTAGSTLNTDNTIDNGANTFTFTNNSLAGDYGFVISSNSTAATASGQVLTGILLSGANANSGQTTTSLIVSNTHTGTSSTNVGVNIVAQGANNNYALIIQPGGGNVGIGTTAPTQLLSLGTAGSTSGIFNIAGSTSGTITFQPQAAAGTYNWNWPTTAGTSGYLLTSGGGGSSAMTWTAPGANTALSNLASVAINTSLLPGVTNSIDLGSSSFLFRTAYLGTSIFSPIVYGGSSSGGNLTIQSTSNGTKGKIFFGATSYVDEANTKNYLTGTTDMGGTAYGDASVILSLNNQTGAGTILGAYTSGAARFSIDQNGNTKQENGSLIGSASGTRDASSILEVRGTTGGVLMPRMTATQASAIGSPADGLIVYVTDTNGTFTAIGFWGRVSGAWTQL